MRGTFGLILAAGIAVAVGWSMLRHSGDDAPGRDGLSGDGLSGDGLSGDEPPASDRKINRNLDEPEQRLPDVKRPTAAASSPLLARVDAAVAAGDLAGAAKLILATERQALADAALRAKALDVADALVRAGDSASATRLGVEQRMQARTLYGVVYDQDRATSAERDRAFTASKALAEILIRGNGAPSELVLRHTVATGQSVWALAKGPWKQAGVSVAPGFVLWMNSVSDARKIRVGQTLKVPLEPLTVVVRKSTFELTVLLGGSPLDRVSVAVGADAKTPVGVFQAKDCLRNPDWYQNGRRIPFGSPENIIGTRWIGLAGGPQIDGIGIHGTNDDTAIGKAVSAGCVRLHNADVERIFEWIAPGTRIEIRD